MTNPITNRLLLLAAVVMALGASAGCSSILDTRRNLADEARILAEGTSPVPLTLITSTEYVGARDPATNEFVIDLIDSDTSQVTELPLEERIPLDDNGRIFVRLWNPDLDATASVRLRVYLDDELVYDVSADMRDAYLEYVFVYF